MLSSYGLKAGEIARIVVFNVTTFWLGFMALGGAVFTLEPARLPRLWLSEDANSRPLGGALLAALSLDLVYVGLKRRSSLTIFGLWIPLPRLSLAASAVPISVLD